MVGKEYFSPFLPNIQDWQDFQIFCRNSNALTLFPKRGENMNITDIRLKKIDNGSKMKAIASITFDDAFVVREIRVIEGQNGLFVAMPSRKTPSGEFRDIAHPINADARQLIQNAILAEYEKAE